MLAGLFELWVQAVLTLAAARGALCCALARRLRPRKARQRKGGWEVSQGLFLALGLVQAVLLAVDKMVPAMAVAVEVRMGLSRHCEEMGVVAMCTTAK